MVDDTEGFEKRVGTVLQGKWTLERLLGVGGMAAVYVGVHKIGRREAIKILHPEIARNKELRARFEQEARAVNQFRHPGAVEIRDIDVTEDGAPFLVMELLDGESLTARAERSESFDTGELLRIADAILDVLAEAHACGIVHRDIKPDNLFLLHDGRVKVLDFGIARMRQEPGASLKTRTGSTLGTLTYMPPEQVKGLAIDARADLFAVGATLFRLLARRRIHEGNSESHVLIKMATESAPPLADVAPHLPHGVCLLVDRALAFQAAQRYPDARTMQSDVRDLLRGEMPKAALAFARTGDFAPTAPPVAAPPAAAFAPQGDPPTRADFTPTAPPASAFAPQGDPPTRADFAAAPAASSAAALSFHTSGPPPVSGDGPTMMATAALGAVVDAFSIARPPQTGWNPTPNANALSIAQPPQTGWNPTPNANALSIAQPAQTGWNPNPGSSPSVAPSTPAPPALWLAVGVGAVALVLGILLILVLSRGNDGDSQALTATSPARRPGGALSTTARAEEAWCGGDCDFECDNRCDMACTGGRCNIEVKPRAKVTCAGSGECALWCEDDCSIKCPGNASCIVHCKPGKRCTIDLCPSTAKQCSNGTVVCDRQCPD